MEKIQKFNLEIALFVKELYSYGENVNEINDETMKLLTETVLGVNKIQINSKFRETSTAHESSFVNNLNNDVFKCRRFIVCCLCHEQIPLSLEDYNIHIQKRNHREKEIEHQSQRQNEFGNHLVRTTSMVLVNDSNGTNQHNLQRSNSSDSNLVQNGNADKSRASSVDNSSCPPSTPSTPGTLKLENQMNFEEVSEAIAHTIKSEFIFRTAQRIAHETKIANNLLHYIKAFDSTLKLKIFGSTTYGFGGSKTNLNFLVNTGDSDQKAIVALYSFEKFLKASAAQSDFEILLSVSGDRVQKRRISVIHNASGIHCLIQFDSSFELAESSQSIRDCILHEPICYHLIVYIRHWQKVINKMLVQNGLRAFEFNTYIISVLVIFFLQLNQNFPKLSDVPASNSKFIHHVPCRVEKEKIKQTIASFFKFYGEKFQMKRQIISVNIGRWQERILQSQQTNFTLEQKRLREGIKENYFNWENCTMYIQDLKSPGTNITAEISEEEANNFQQMCKMFASDDSHEQSIDAYLLQLGKMQSKETNGSTSTPKLSEASLNALQSLDNSITNKINTSASSSTCDRSIASSISISSNPATTQKLRNLINIEQVSKTIPSKTVDLINRMVGRCFHEMEIFALLTRYLKTFNSTLKVMPFGSATYGFGGSTTNFNILVNTGDQKPFTIFQSFEKLFKTTAVQNDFKILPSISGNRVQNRRLPVIHNTSGILCWIQFDSNFELAKSSLIVRNYVMIDPICHHLIAYVRAWQNSLNEIAAQNGMHAFQFNTYVISILVIFFLQLNHTYPKLADLPSYEVKSIDFVPKIEKEKLKKLTRQFFEFYGKYYEINCKVISVDVGRWQNRELDRNQSNFTPAQKRLREGIELNTSSWENCAMYVQDLELGANAAAEISKQEANNFKEMCRAFDSSTLHKQIVDEYLLKLSQTRTLSLNGAYPMKKSNYELSEASLNSLQRFKDVIANLDKQTSDEKASSSSRSSISSSMSVTNTNSNVGAHSLPNSVKKLEDVIKVDDILKSTKVAMSSILTRSISRIQSDKEIISLLSFLLTTYDPTTTIVPFGSITYGFGGNRTNLNLLIITGIQSTTEVLRTSFENLVKTTGLQQDFEFLCHVKTNRVQSEHMKILHKKSGIECVIQFASEKERSRYLKKTQIILDYMSLHPMCKRLIGYIKAWSNALNEAASKNGLVAFNMNSYIISVLVIFYLQLNHGLPTATESSSAIVQGLKYPTKNNLGQFIKEFFDFYGKKYEKVHLISVNVGKWQQKEQGEQRHFSPAQKGLRDGMKQCPENWENCTMFVQDIVSLGTNITAEITKKEVDNFVRMCQIFAKHVLKFEDECMKSHVKPINPVGDRALSVDQSTNVLELVEKIITNSHVPAVLAVRQRAELEIISTLTKYIREFRPSLKLYPFGSAQYGIKFAYANLNVLIVDDAAIEAPNNLCERLFMEWKFWNTDISNHFKEIYQVEENRVMGKQINMVHIKSGIQCLIAFQNNSIITESVDIIRRFTNYPMCNRLITFIRMWQTILNQLNVARFEFNTYTISILVIFFLQMNHKFPTTDQSPICVCPTNLNFKLILKEFFAFYGNRYQIWNHVISTQIGRWQERRIQPQQTTFTSAQKRLREGIEKSPENWKNCTMYVQDLIRPNVNVTAEITKEVADKFQEMCQIFAKKLD